VERFHTVSRELERERSTLLRHDMGGRLIIGLSCRCQTLPKGSPGRPCEKCRARNKAGAAKTETEEEEKKEGEKD
jgi:hypothetical protein